MRFDFPVIGVDLPLYLLLSLPGQQRLSNDP
jgi:hypothetical protein